jgi:NarL family two-component system response regulator YdfI
VLNYGIRNAPRPLEEALSARLTSDESQVASAAEPGPGFDVVFAYCAIGDDWTFVAEQLAHSPVVAILANLDIEEYVRALGLGAGAVHFDTSTEIMSDVARATMTGESLVPTVVAQQLANLWRPPTDATILTAEERDVARMLVEGLSMQRIAQTMSYSERTVRRRLQSLYLKLGAADRQDALTIIRKNLPDTCPD